MSAGLLAALHDLVPALQRRAEALDAAEAPPLQDMAELRALGALTAPLPRAHGGLGAGTEPGGAALLLDMLRLIGRGHLAVARLFEAHVNAVRLVARYGTPAQLAAAARDVHNGHLFALWVTDPPGAASPAALRLVTAYADGPAPVSDGPSATAPPARAVPSSARRLRASRASS